MTLNILIKPHVRVGVITHINSARDTNNPVELRSMMSDIAFCQYYVLFTSPSTDLSCLQSTQPSFSMPTSSESFIHTHYCAYAEPSGKLKAAPISAQNSPASVDRLEGNVDTEDDEDEENDIGENGDENEFDESERLDGDEDSEDDGEDEELVDDKHEGVDDHEFESEEKEEDDESDTSDGEAEFGNDANEDEFDEDEDEDEYDIADDEYDDDEEDD